MNELYEQTIEVKGRRYRYDPDFDAYYRIHEPPSETLKQRIVKIVLAVAVLVVLIYFFGDPWFFDRLGEKL